VVDVLRVVPTSDISGKEVPPGTGGIVRLVVAGKSEQESEYRLTAGEVLQLLEWAKAAAPQGIVLTAGRRSDISGRVIGQAAGATLDLEYYDEEGKEEKLALNLTDDEVASLTGKQVTVQRLKHAGYLALGATAVVLILAGLINSGLVLRHPVWTLMAVTAATVLIATLFWKALERVSSRAVVLASGLGVVLTTVFAIAPNLKPETSQSLDIGKITVERGVLLSDFYSSPTMQYVFSRACDRQTCPEFLVSTYCDAVRKDRQAAQCPPPPAQSFIVYAPVESTGFTSQPLRVSFRVFDKATDEPVDPQPLDPWRVLDVGFPEKREADQITEVFPEKREADQITLPVWIDATVTKAKKLYVRIYVADKRGLMLATGTSPAFPSTKE
jgi:uncharacterized membrane protein